MLVNLRIAFMAAALLEPFPLASQELNQDRLLRWMDAIAQGQLQRRETEIAQVHTVADAERRKQSVRAKILDALGGLPEYSGPLNARVTGKIQADGYVIEKVIYESLPGFYVTANLYRPNQAGRYPGVLLQAGHTQEGKAEPQRLAANLALNGFVALAFDPVGQGEREQTYDPQLKAPAAGWSVNEHLHEAAQSSLVGEGVARYFIWDAKRSLDYLASRPDVDPQRLGAAGCSGGGALTTFIGGLDARLKSVIPACFPNSYRIAFAQPSGFNSEMTLPQHIARGLDTADFVELSAPTPWLLQATEHDYFTPAGAKLVYEEARRWYRLYGAEDKVGLFVGPGPHGTPLVSREAVYEWLIRWLKNGHGDFHEQPVKTYANHELLVTRSGRVDDEPRSRKLNQLILDTYRAKRRPGTAAELQSELRRLKIPTNGLAPVVQILDQSRTERFSIERIRYESEPEIEIDARLYVPRTAGRKPAVLLLAGRLSDQLTERIAAAGRVVLKLEPRHSNVPDDRRPFLGDWLTNTRADQIGRSLPAMRAHDILRGVDLLCARRDVDPASIRAAGQGVRGIWLLLAAAADPRIRKLWLDKTPASFVEALENTVNTSLFDTAIHGFVLRWDIPDLVKAMGDRPIMWTDPVNWMGRVVSLGSRYQYRWVLGDITEMADVQDNQFADELMK
jgi:cephalosporin-C deacetylase-like acetyl esterase